MPLYPQSVTSQGVCLDSLHFSYFLFRLTFKSFKELRSASVTYLLHKKISSCLHPYKVYLATTIFPFYKLVHVGIKCQSLNYNFLFSFLRYVEASCKQVLPHLAPSHQNHKHFVNGKVKKIMFLKQPRLDINVIEDAKTNPKRFYKSMYYGISAKTNVLFQRIKH